MAVAGEFSSCLAFTESAYFQRVATNHAHYICSPPSTMLGLVRFSFVAAILMGDRDISYPHGVGVGEKCFSCFHCPSASGSGEHPPGKELGGNHSPHLHDFQLLSPAGGF